MNGCKLLALCLLLLICFPVFAQRVTYIHTDALGSPVVLTDANRNVVERREYEPYGRQLTAAPQDGPGYTGHVYDAATGMVYMQQRYYDPFLGRFLSVDPVAADGDSGASFNRYRYANNNPYLFFDPDGRKANPRCPGSTNPFCVASIQINGSSQASNQSRKSGPLLAQAIPLPVPMIMPPPPVSDDTEWREDESDAGNNELARRIARQIDRIKERLKGPDAEQYALIATFTRSYIDVRGNVKDLKAGDVWKYGQTTDPSARYSASSLRRMGLRYETQFVGSQRDVLIMEKMKIYQYYLDHGELPPGNKIFK